MSLSLRRLRPDALFDSFLGVLDIKLGAEIILLFGLINKVAGVYGLVTIFVGGTLTQLAFYAYCIATLFALLWALKVVKAESTNSTLLVAHLYILDHFIQSLFHYLFYYDYWYNQPHDGRRPVNSRAQQDLINLAVSRGEIIDPATQTSQGIEDLRAALAGEIWESESKFASWTIVVGFFFKLYCALVLYSYAAHLRSSTYHALPMTAKPKTTQSALPQAPALRAEVENFSAPETSATRPDRSRRTVDYVENEEDFHWEE